MVVHQKFCHFALLAPRSRLPALSETQIPVVATASAELVELTEAVRLALALCPLAWGAEPNAVSTGRVQELDRCTGTMAE